MAEPLIAGLLCLFICLASGDNVTLNKNAVRKSDLQMFIDTGTITNQVVLKKPDGSVEGKCLAPLSGKSGNCSANFAQSGTRTTVTLSSVSRANHQGVWTSEHGRDKGNINITVLTVPASITEQSPAVTDFELTTCTSKTLTVVVECAYPSVQIDWEFVTDVPSSTGICKTCTDMGLTGGACSDAAAKTFHCDFTVTETSTASLSAGKYKLKANLYMDGEVTSTGISVELSTIITIPASSSICDSCRTINALAVIGLFVAVGCVVLYWIVYFQLSGRLQGPCSVFTKSKSGGGNGELECSVTWCFRATIIATVVSVIGLILCIAGLIICVTCDDSVSSSNSVTVGFNLALVGFVLAAVTLVIAIIDVILFFCNKTMKKDGVKTAVISPPDAQERGRPHIDLKPLPVEMTEMSPRTARSPTAARNIKKKWKNNHQVSDSNEIAEAITRAEGNWKMYHKVGSCQRWNWWMQVRKPIRWSH